MERVIHDPDGEVVARDGEIVVIHPEARLPGGQELAAARMASGCTH
jgi:hypothetical protein